MTHIPHAKDGQTVNTALMAFLNDLTTDFDYTNIVAGCCTRHSFSAKYEAAKNEARTDGYLVDGNESPSQSLIKVELVIRAILRRIQMGVYMSR